MRTTIIRRRAVSALAVSLALLAPSCSLLHRDAGRYASLPVACGALQDSSRVKEAIDSAFAQIPGSHTLALDNNLPGFLGNNDSFQNLNCKSDASLDATAAASTGQPKSRTLYITLTLYARGKQHGSDSVKEAARLLKPNPAGVGNAAITPEAGVGDEAYSLWDGFDTNPNHSRREVVFRVSNMNVNVTLTGNNFVAGTDFTSRIEGDGKSPQLRQDLERNTLNVAKAIATWLQNDWKG